MFEKQPSFSMIDLQRPYRRTVIRFSLRTKASMQQAALIRGGEGIAVYIDVYTVKPFEAISYDYEHLRSSGSDTPNTNQ
jgi:hypothetical protein